MFSSENSNLDFLVNIFFLCVSNFYFFRYTSKIGLQSIRYYGVISGQEIWKYAVVIFYANILAFP